MILSARMSIQFEFFNIKYIIFAMDSFECPICLETLYRPTTLACQHNFCYQCIKGVINQLCPMCRAGFILPKTYNKLLDDMIIKQRNRSENAIAIISPATGCKDSKSKYPKRVRSHRISPFMQPPIRLSPRLPLRRPASRSARPTR